jgi:hypothetical protein
MYKQVQGEFKAKKKGEREEAKCERVSMYIQKRRRNIAKVPNASASPNNNKRNTNGER